MHFIKILCPIGNELLYLKRSNYPTDLPCDNHFVVGSKTNFGTGLYEQHFGTPINMQTILCILQWNGPL
jgi:hypothetical protein